MEIEVEIDVDGAMQIAVKFDAPPPLHERIVSTLKLSKDDLADLATALPDRISSFAGDVAWKCAQIQSRREVPV